MEPLDFTAANLEALRWRLAWVGAAAAVRVPPVTPLPADEVAFLRAVLADPADSLPRLVYADWLEDRGDPRGEFLRLATRLRDEEKVFSRDRPALRGRLDELRPLLPAPWRTAFDPARRGYVVWDRADRDRLAAQAPRDPLRAVPRRGQVNEGYVYVLTLVDGRLVLVSRMRMAGRGKADDFRGTEGLPIRIGPVIPAALADRVAFVLPGRQTRAVRRLKVDPDGRVTNLSALHGGTTLAADTALLFDVLLNGWLDPAEVPGPVALTGAT